MGLVAPWHIGSSWERDAAHAPRIGRWVLHHWATGAAPDFASHLNVLVGVSPGVN